MTAGLQDERKKEREELGDEAPPKLVPKTLDNMREYDVTTVGGKRKHCTLPRQSCLK